MNFTVVLLSIFLVAIAMFGLAIQIMFSKKKKLPEYKVGHNKKMREKKIYCIKTQQKIIDKKIACQTNNPTQEDCSVCE